MYHTARIIQSGDGNAKIRHHGEEFKAYTISLASSDSSGKNTCPRAMPRGRIQRFLDQGRTLEWIRAYARERGLSMCSLSCVLWEGGHGRTDHVRDARINLTNWYYEDRKSFRAALLAEAESIERNRGPYRIACRPDTDSDIKWEKTIPQMFAFNWDWYDYTKLPERLLDKPANYHLTYSVNDGTTKDDLRLVYKAKANICVVFDSLWNPQWSKFGYLPATYRDALGRVWPVIDGDQSDFRFLDPAGVCVGLRLKAGLDAKDNARESEFSVPVDDHRWGTLHPADAPANHYIAA